MLCRIRRRGENVKGGGAALRDQKTKGSEPGNASRVVFDAFVVLVGNGRLEGCTEGKKKNKAKNLRRILRKTGRRLRGKTRKS